MPNFGGKDLSALDLALQAELAPVDSASDPIFEFPDPVPKVPEPQITSPKDLFKALSEVKGNVHAKKTMSTLLFLHEIRTAVVQMGGIDPDTLPHDVALLMGQTGTGKTFLMEEISRLRNIPITFIDASQASSIGYKGKSLLWWYEEHAYNCAKWGHAHGSHLSVEDLMRKGILYIDEIDKRTTGGISTLGEYSQNLQSNLLTTLQGSIVSSDSLDTDTTHRSRVNYNLNSRDILHVLSGAFAGIEKLNEEGRPSIGFSSHEDSKPKTPTREALIKYGMMSELVGRISTITFMEKPTYSVMYEILTQSKYSPIAKYRTMFKLCGVNIGLSAKAAKKITEMALKSPSNIRALQQIIDSTLQPMLYEVDAKSFEPIVIKEKDVVSL